MIIEELKSLEEESIRRGIPIIGSEKGSWLYSKVKELKPKKVLELGTANGYSGIILGSEGASLTTIDINKKIVEEAKTNFETFNIKANVLVGDAEKEAKKLSSKKEMFDLIYIDHYKRGYIAVLEDCIKMVRKGGLIIADNIIFPGCQDYREAVLSHPKLRTEIINIKDGLSCSKIL